MDNGFGGKEYQIDKKRVPMPRAPRKLSSVDKIFEIHKAQLLKIHKAQLLTYMKLAKIKIGLLLNFNVLRLKDGLKRYVL